MINEQRLIDTFLKLVSIYSPTNMEREIADYLRHFFSSHGLKVIEDNTNKINQNGAGNLICELKENTAGIDSVFFAAHMDTVQHEKNIVPSLTNGIIHSDGKTILGADDKVGISVMMETVQLIKEQDLKHGDIQFIITTGEESELKGSKQLDYSLITPDFGYVLDGLGPVGGIITSSKNLYVYHITFSSPHNNKNLMKIARHATKEIKKLNKSVEISYFGGDVGTITREKYVDVILTYSALHPVLLIRDITSICTILSNNEEIDFTYKTKEIYPMLKVDNNEKLVQVAKRAAKNLNIPSEICHSDYGSDANIFNRNGKRAVNLSTGYRHIHTVNETIEIDELIRLCHYVLGIINQIKGTNEN